MIDSIQMCLSSICHLLFFRQISDLRVVDAAVHRVQLVRHAATAGLLWIPAILERHGFTELVMMMELVGIGRC